MKRLFDNIFSLLGLILLSANYVNMFTEEEGAVLSVRPGIRDWASIWGSDEGVILAGSPDPERIYMGKIRIFMHSVPSNS